MLNYENTLMYEEELMILSQLCLNEQGVCMLQQI